MSDTIEGGGLSELYPWPLGPNLVQNGDLAELDPFTQRPRGWAVSQPGMWTYPLTEEGERYAELKDTGGQVAPSMSRKYQTPGGWHTVQGEARVDTVASGGARITASAKAGSTESLSGTSDWLLLERRSFNLPAGEHSVKLESYQRPTGVLNYRNVAVYRQTPPLAEAYLLSPNYRGYIWMDGDQQVRVRVNLSPTDYELVLNDMRVRLLLETDAGNPVASVEVVPTVLSFSLSVDATSAPEGPLRLRLQVFAGKTPFLSEYPSYLLRKVTPQERSTFSHWIDTDGVLVRHGQRHFVLGMYDTGGFSTLPAFWDKIALPLSQAGFTHYLNYWITKAPGNALKALMDAFGARGVSYLHTTNDLYPTSAAWAKMPAVGGKRPSEYPTPDDYVLARIGELAQHPWYGGEYTWDERLAETAPKVFAQYKILRRANPCGVSYGVSNKPDEIVRWRDACDAWGTDSYPIRQPAGTLSPLEQVSQWNDAAVAASYGTRPVWCVLQFWQTIKASHWPTAEEHRSMAWQAIVGGAKGLWWWSYGSGAFANVKDPAQRAALWADLTKTTLEVAGLEPFLISRDASGLLVPNLPPQLRVLQRRVGTSHLIAAVNVGSTPLTAVPFTLSSLPTAPIVVLNEGRVVNLTNNEFVDDFGPYAVHLYQTEAQ